MEDGVWQQRDSTHLNGSCFPDNLIHMFTLYKKRNNIFCRKEKARLIRLSIILGIFLLHSYICSSLMCTLPEQKNCCNPHLLSEGVSRCCLMWFLRGGSCTRLVRRNQLLHRCTNGPFTGHINQGAPGLGHCPESTVQRESHLTPVHWLKETSIITVQHSACNLLFSFPPPPPRVHSPPAISALFSICISMVPLFSSSSSSPPLPVLCHALHTFQPIAIRTLRSEEKCHIFSCYWLCSAQISSDSFLLHCLPAWRQRQLYINDIQICAIWADHRSVLSFFNLLWYVVYNVYCYSSKDWFENEKQMEKVIIDVEMFTTRNKQSCFKIS